MSLYVFRLIIKEFPVDYLALLIRVGPFYLLTLFASLFVKSGISSLGRDCLMILLLNAVLTVAVSIGVSLVFMIKAFMIKRKKD